jgi:hypothetical protein
MRRILPIFAVLGACGASEPAPEPTPAPSVGDGKTPATSFALELVNGKKLSKIFPKGAQGDYEASGVVAQSGSLYTVFDNATHVGVIDTSLSKGTLGPGEAIESQYEGITTTDDGRFYAVVEVVSEADPRAAIAELSSDTAFVSQSFTDVSFEHLNKGLEGIAWLRVDGSEYLLGLCQNNDCKNDDTKPGKGRIVVLRSEAGAWVTEATLKLPTAAAFLDYSDVALRPLENGSFALAVASHRSSALWLGTLSTAPWAIGESGTFYSFPRDDSGQVRYCSVEGITFLGPSLVAAVSDRSDGSKPCSDTEESIHVFRLPQ